jgi:hypothetical protein
MSIVAIFMSLVGDRFAAASALTRNATGGFGFGFVGVGSHPLHEDGFMALTHSVELCRG